MIHKLRKIGLKYTGRFLLISFCCLLVSFNSFGQNIFLNGDFEIEERNKKDIVIPQNWKVGLQSKVKTPDYYYKGINLNFPKQELFWEKMLKINQTSFIGIGCDERSTEYYQTKFSSPVIPEKKYQISFDVFLDKRCVKHDSIFLLLSLTEDIDTSFVKLTIPIPKSQPLLWTPIKQKFSVDKEMNYFALGSFEYRSNYNHERDRKRDIKDIDSFGCTYLYFDNLNLQIANPVILEFVYFKTDSHIISKYEYEKINRLTSAIDMSNRKSAEISLTGYADDIGSEDSNIKLSQRRVDSIKKILLELGFLNKNITVQAKGEIDISENEGIDEERQLNRRVEMKIEY